MWTQEFWRTTPHTYFDEEIVALLEKAAQLGPKGGLRPHTYVTLFGLLIINGLRISEALALTPDDVNLDRGLLRIHASKFKQSRLVPLHGTTTGALRGYTERRSRYHPLARSKAFFLTEQATPLKYWWALMTFIALRRPLGGEAQERTKPPI